MTRAERVTAEFFPPGFPILPFYRLLCVLRIRMLIEIRDGNVGAFAREEHRDGAADAGVTAGDQRSG